MIYKNVLDLIGNTPIIEHHDIFIKLESFNIAGSIKDRVALKILEQTKTNKDSTVIEVTSGNTGIAIAMVCAIKHLKCIIIMLDNVSEEKIKILKAYNAKVILTPSKFGMKYAIDLAKRLEKEKGYVFLNQFHNQNNIMAHYQTGKEICDDFESLDYLVCGIGTGGSITGLSKTLKDKFPNIQIIGVEPSESAVLSSPKSKIVNHGIQGIGAGFKPSILDLDGIDKIETVSTKDAIDTFFDLANQGLLLGLSSAANYYVSKKIKENNPTKKILMISADSGHKYLHDLVV